MPCTRCGKLGWRKPNSDPTTYICWSCRGIEQRLPKFCNRCGRRGKRVPGDSAEVYLCRPCRHEMQKCCTKCGRLTKHHSKDSAPRELYVCLPCRQGKPIRRESQQTDRPCERCGVTTRLYNDLCRDCRDVLRDLEETP